MLKINAVIMAAGLSKRMGKNKLLLPFKNKTLIECFMDNIPFNMFDKINFIYTDEKVKHICSSYDINFIKNNYPEKGKGFTVFLGQTESLDSNGTMYFTSDQPLIKMNTIKKIIETFFNNPDSIIIPKVKNNTFNPVIYPSACFDSLLKIENDSGGKSILNRYEHMIHFVNFDSEEEFKDIDTQKDYKILLKSERL